MDDEVRGDVCVGAHGAAHEIPEAASGERHVGRAEGLAAALPTAERAAVALDPLRGEGVPRGVAHRSGAHDDAGERLLFARTEKDFTGLRGLGAEAPAVLHPVLRARLGVVHDHAGGRDGGGFRLRLLRCTTRGGEGVERMLGVGLGLLECGGPRGGGPGAEKGFGQAPQAGAERAGGGLKQLALLIGAQLRELRGDFAMRLHCGERGLAIGAADEETGERVVVALGDGIELVVVAAGAGDGHAEEGFRHHVEAVVHAVALVLADVHGRMHFLAEEPEAGAEDGFVAAGVGVQAGLRDEVAGEVLDDELVVRHVGVEGADDVVAVVVGVRDDWLELVTARLGVTDEVEPVACPALAESRGGEEGINEIADCRLPIAD